MDEYGESLVSLEETQGGLHWVAEGADGFNILLEDDMGQQTEIHVTDLVGRPLTLWRLDSDSLSQVNDFWEEWQRYEKPGLPLH
jgi:hypothetical protein